jgi:hypothetical protein
MLVELRRINVFARRFDVAQTYPDSIDPKQQDPLPKEIIFPNGNITVGPSMWKIAPNQSQISLQPYVPSEGLNVVVISHPGCGFSRLAMRALMADPQLAKKFRQDALWLIPQDSRLDFDSLQQWNRDKNNPEHYVVHRTKDWHFDEMSATPIFYFTRNGAVETKIVGWPRDNRNLPLIKRALQQ